MSDSSVDKLAICLNKNIKTCIINKFVVIVWSLKWKEKVKVIQSSLTLQPHGLHGPWNSPGQDTEASSLSLLEGIFPTQGSSPGLPHCRQILYQLSRNGNPRILEGVAYPFSSGSCWPRNQTWVSCITGRFFSNWARGKPSQCIFLNSI